MTKDIFVFGSNLRGAHGKGAALYARRHHGAIVDIKLGKLLYQDVAAEIEGLLEKVEQAAAESILPDEPDHGWIADFIVHVHRHEIKNERFDLYRPTQWESFVL